MGSWRGKSDLPKYCSDLDVRLFDASACGDRLDESYLLLFDVCGDSSAGHEKSEKNGECHPFHFFLTSVAIC